MDRLTAYVAFNERDAHEVELQGELTVSMFAPCRIIPLRNTPDAAIMSALNGMTTHCVKAAMEETDWFFIELKINAAMVGTLFMENHLHNSPDNLGWRCTTSIKLAGVGTSWLKGTKPALGLESWAEMTLRGKRLKSTTCCSGCSDSGGDDYCPQCWQVFFSKVSRQSIFDKIG
jgi:hypothetical protein